MKATMNTAEPEEVAEVGELIGGYRLEKLIGAGSMSRVFLGVHTRVGRRSAVKVLSSALVDDQRSVTRLLNEARAVNDIRHPNIVDIYDFVESQSPRRIALIMELIEGPSLKRYLKDESPSFGQSVGIVLQLIEAVDAAHAAGVIHRDIKPDNLLLVFDSRDPSATPTLKVADFGIAKIAGAHLEKTASGVMIGTPAYMAPEQIAGSPPPGRSTDVFAIGEVFFELLTGRRAFPQDNLSAMVKAKLSGAVPDLSLPAVPARDELRDLIARSLSERQDLRPTTREYRELLTALVEERPARGSGPSYWDRPTAGARGGGSLDVDPSSATDPGSHTEPEPEAELPTRLARPDREPAADPHEPTMLAVVPDDDRTQAAYGEDQTDVGPTPGRGGPELRPRSLTPRGAVTPALAADPTQPAGPSQVTSPSLGVTPALATPAPSRAPSLVAMGLATLIGGAIATTLVLALTRPASAPSIVVPPPAPAEVVPVPAERAEAPREAPPALTEVALTSLPSGARVEDPVSGAALGVTPVVLSLRPPTELRLTLAGHRAREVTVALGVSELTVELEREERRAKPTAKRPAPRREEAPKPLLPGKAKLGDFDD